MSIPFIEWFYKVILTSANSVPIQSLWVAFFTNPACLNRALQTSRLENGFGYATLAPGAAINTGQSGMGALFANSVTIPGDGMDVSKIGMDGMGPIKGNISSGRKDLENITISFLDTNVSFCDYNIRPWAIYASHKSLKDPTVKTTLTVIQFMKTEYKKPLLPRAIWTYHGACPVSLESQQWNYGADNVVNRQVTFAYNYYTLNADPALTPLLAVKSIFDPDGTNYSGQPITVPKGGLTGHGTSQLKTVSSNDSTSLESHAEGQPVIIPEDDMVSRGINIGLDILNGNTNVIIPNDDAVNRLRSIGEQLQNMIKVPESDIPIRTEGGDQTGFVEKRSDGVDGEHRISRRNPERESSGRISVGGNSKQNAKDNSDTPLFFPNDGEEFSVKIGGRTVGGELDTPEVQTMSVQPIEIEPTGDVGKKIPLQLININREDMRRGGSTNDNPVVVNADDHTNEFHGTAKIITIPENDSIDGFHGNPKVVIVPKQGAVGANIPMQIVTIKKEK